MQKRRKSSECKKAEITAKAVFSYYDKDGNGFLDPQEVLQFIQDVLPQCDPEKPALRPEAIMANLLKIADENGDNKISLRELTELVLKIFEAKDRH